MDGECVTEGVFDGECDDDDDVESEGDAETEAVPDGDGVGVRVGSPGAVTESDRRLLKVVVPAGVRVWEPRTVADRAGERDDDSECDDEGVEDGQGVCDGECDGEREDEGLEDARAEAEGERVAEGLEDACAEADGEREAEGLKDARAEADGEAIGDSDGSDAEADGDGKADSDGSDAVADGDGDCKADPDSVAMRVGGLNVIVPVRGAVGAGDFDRVARREGAVVDDRDRRGDRDALSEDESVGDVDGDRDCEELPVVDTLDEGD